MEKGKPAHSDLFENISERFCKCPLCKKQLNDARRLPCAHRYCMRCLDKAIRAYQAENHQGQYFPCPKCQQEVPIPPRGAIDLKADVWVSEMISLGELRDKLTSGTKSGICGCCSNGGELTAFCMDCDGFVCMNCCSLHERLEVLKTHNIFKLDDGMKQNKTKIDLRKLVSFTPAPKCKEHKGMQLELSCRTCDNCLICLKCALVRHADHDKQDVSEAVKVLRAELHRERVDVASKRQISLTFRKQNEKSYEKMGSMFESIFNGIEHKYKFCEEKCKEEEDSLTSADSSAIEKIEGGRDFDVQALESKAEESIEEVKREMMKRINKINEELSMKVKSRTDFAQRQIDVIAARMNAKLKDIVEKRDRLGEDRRKLLHVVASSKKSSSIHLNECNKNIDEMLIRLQYLNENVDALVGVSSQWSFVETGSDLLVTMGNLKMSLEDNQLESQTMSTPALAFEPDETPSRIGHLLWTINRQFQVVTGGRFGMGNWKIESVVSLGIGNIAVAGTNTSKESGIDFITYDGKPFRQKNFISDDHDFWCLCKANDNHMLACRGANVEILNVSNGESVRKINVKRLPTWRPDDMIVSVAYDGNMNEIMVCRQKSNEVFVFDKDLKYLRSFKMPGPNKGPFSMVVSGDVLLACAIRKEGYVMGVDLGTTNVVTRFNPTENDHKALGICCDSANVVYILWKRKTDICVVQYTNHGETTLGLPVHSEAVHITIAKSSEGSEDLVVTTRDGRLAFYKLPLRKGSTREKRSSLFNGIEPETLEKYMSRRFHWLSVGQKYELKDTFDFVPIHSDYVPAAPIESGVKGEHTLLV